MVHSTYSIGGLRIPHSNARISNYDLNWEVSP
jgi:hypothetical protein